MQFGCNGENGEFPPHNCHVSPSSAGVCPSDGCPCAAWGDDACSAGPVGSRPYHAGASSSSPDAASYFQECVGRAIAVGPATHSCWESSMEEHIDTGVGASAVRARRTMDISRACPSSSGESVLAAGSTRPPTPVAAARGLSPDVFLESLVAYPVLCALVRRQQALLRAVEGWGDAQQGVDHTIAAMWTLASRAGLEERDLTVDMLLTLLWMLDSW